MATKSAQRITKCHLGPPVTASWDWMTIPPVGGGAGGTGDGGGGGGGLLVSFKTAMIKPEKTKTNGVQVAKNLAKICLDL